jgi:UDP-2,3-diacylglucosamine pyrophosphatase LpxH
MPARVIVSDPHIDTWTDTKYGISERNKTKLDHWRDFLSRCKEAGIEELIINGDLMDAPPYDEGNLPLASPTVCDALAELAGYAAHQRVTYILGNHDIGMSGLRFGFEGHLPWLKNVSFCYPNCCLPIKPNVLLIEHGHLSDPAMSLYRSDLMARTYPGTDDYRSYQFDNVRWPAGTRRRRAEDKPSPGRESPNPVRLGPPDNLTVEEAIDRADTRRTRWSRASLWLPRKVRLKIDHETWRGEARKIFKRFTSEHPTLSNEVAYCVMGHTHVPDRFWEPRPINGRRCCYLNSGTWAGSGIFPEDQQNATYLYVDEDGTITPYDWIWAPGEL